MEWHQTNAAKELRGIRKRYGPNRTDAPRQHYLRFAKLLQGTPMFCSGHTEA